MTTEEKLAKAVKALEWYAKGEPTREWPWREFGCGCCSTGVKFHEDGDDFDVDYDTYGEAQGRLARETLQVLNAEPEIIAMAAIQSEKDNES